VSEVKRGFLGAQFQDLDPDIAEAFGLSQHQGAVLVNVIAGSSAEKAGLKPGDVITAIDGRPVYTASAVRNEIGVSAASARKYTVAYCTNNQTLNPTSSAQNENFRYFK
jgi:S1-C subfamily serine protease